METYAKVILIATPFFMGLVVLEKLYAYLKFGHKTRFFDVISSLSSGTTNSLKDVLGLSISILSYGYMVNNWAFYKIENTFLTYLVAFMVLDFSGYWVHRLSHAVNIFWNKHAIHHSSEEFDLACALRQSISSFVSLFTFFLLPAALLGVPQMVIAIIAPIHLFAQFWYHTIYIGKLGFLEKIIVTPSHHRVHHAINPEYIDKNHGQIFIFWDKWFSTFQEELDDVKPVFGITRPASTWNPIKINFQHLILLIQDAFRAENWKDKLSIWFKPTGWRPTGFEEKYPVKKINDPFNFKKYDTSENRFDIFYISLQFTLLLGFTVLFYGKIASFEFWQMLCISLFIFIHVYTFSMYMDREKHWFLANIVKDLLGILALTFFGFLSPLFEELNLLKTLLISVFALNVILIFIAKYQVPRNLKEAI